MPAKRSCTFAARWSPGSKNVLAMGKPVCVKPWRPATRIFSQLPRNWNVSCSKPPKYGSHDDRWGCQPLDKHPGATRFGTSLASRLESNMKPKKILIVDDSVVVLKTISQKLTAHGYEAITAEDGGSAVSVVRQQKPDLILLDLWYPPDV